MRAHLHAVALLAAACGDNGGGTVDDARPPDAGVSPDAAPCVGYVIADQINVSLLDLQLPVALDGVGTRCEQLARAVREPGAFPAELEPFTAYDYRVECEESGEIDRVTFIAERLDGVAVRGWPGRLEAVVQDGLVIQWTGYYYPTDRLPPRCRDAAELQLAMLEVAFPYRAYTATCGTDSELYTPVAGDTFDIGEEKFYYLSHTIYRSRTVDVHLLPSHVTSEIKRSNMFCCPDSSLVDCVGMHLEMEVSGPTVLEWSTFCDDTCVPL